ncbi:hypothetical protein F511_32619 [Dorcoceras hygrometricum]|uniref:Uncharacterized protein n=1 Tax=Dorcoceras hygrometricum TaxID=472368 RepID=A0A2Z7CU00_9LAMI|nr:hypothetical protein F511_32619 [Dorcoceras hygrometricum]
MVAFEAVRFLCPKNTVPKSESNTSDNLNMVFTDSSGTTSEILRSEAGGQSLGQSQQGSAGGSSQRPQPVAQSQRSGFQPRESSRFGGPSRPQFPRP